MSIPLIWKLCDNGRIVASSARLTTLIIHIQEIYGFTTLKEARAFGLTVEGWPAVGPVR